MSWLDAEFFEDFFRTIGSIVSLIIIGVVMYFLALNMYSSIVGSDTPTDDWYGDDGTHWCGYESWAGMRLRIEECQ